jgi:hypothetical protein
MMDPVVPGSSNGMRTPPRSRNGGGSMTFQGGNGNGNIPMTAIRPPNMSMAVDPPPADYNYPQAGNNIVNNNNNNGGMHDTNYSTPPPQSGRISAAGGGMPPMGMLPPPSQFTANNNSNGPPSARGSIVAPGGGGGHMHQGSMSMNGKGGNAWTNSPMTNNGGAFPGVAEEDLNEQAEPPALARHTPIWWLLVSIVILAIFAAADVFSYIALPLPKFTSDGDKFTMAGWIIHFTGVLIFICTMLIVGLRKDPFSPGNYLVLIFIMCHQYLYDCMTIAVLMGYLFALAAFIGGMILHTSRLIPDDVFSSSSSSSNDNSTSVTSNAAFELFDVTTNATNTTTSDDFIELTWFGNNARYALCYCLDTSQTLSN